MEKINIAEILKDCPKGMELDCTMCDNVYLDEVTPYMIKCFIRNNVYNTIYFNHDGTYLTAQNAKCVIFPKGKTTWEGFQRPFKDGDVITCTNSIRSFVAIFKKIQTNTTFIRYVSLTLDDEPQFWAEEGWADFKKPRFATEKEKQKLFDAIKANGYKWNPDTKTLEKLIVPKFKVGDRIKEKRSGMCGEIIDVQNNRYDVKIDDKGLYVYFREQNDWELLPNKFDITTLKPFESRVLVRTSNHKKWVAAFYSHYDKDSLLLYCVVGGLWYEQCIPFEDNEHLLNTTNSCDDFYKNW